MFRTVSVIFIAFLSAECFTKILLTCRVENNGTSTPFRNESQILI